MITNKYEDLCKKSPLDAAAVVCEVEKRNFFAHSIREIENALAKAPYFMLYRIIVRVSVGKSRDAAIFFRNKCCEIILPSDCETINEKKIRFSLAHELGHFVRNISNLNDATVLDNNSPDEDEEIYAWEFAYHLVRLKSEQHKKRNLTEFVYGDMELRRSLHELIMEKNPEIYEKLPASIRI